VIAAMISFMSGDVTSIARGWLRVGKFNPRRENIALRLEGLVAGDAMPRVSFAPLWIAKPVAEWLG
jgi:hypothetical protein